MGVSTKSKLARLFQECGFNTVSLRLVEDSLHGPKDMRMPVAEEQPGPEDSFVRSSFKAGNDRYVPPGIQRMTSS